MTTPANVPVGVFEQEGLNSAEDLFKSNESNSEDAQLDRSSTASSSTNDKIILIDTEDCQDGIPFSSGDEFDACIYMNSEKEIDAEDCCARKKSNKSVRKKINEEKSSSKFANKKKKLKLQAVYYSD